MSGATGFLPDLTSRPQWVLWRSEKRGGKPTKVPYQVNGRLASSTDPKTWNTYQRVTEVYQANGRTYSGVGFVFSPDDPFCGIDVDNCIADGPQKWSLKEWAEPLLAPFCGTYAEISPSGKGIKIWCKAKLPGSGKRTSCHDGAIETYDQGRFFTFTGQICSSASSQVLGCQQAVDDLYALISGQRRQDSPAKPKADLTTSSKIPEGQRHDYLLSVAAQYRAKGMDRTEILAAVRAVNGERCEPPKSDEELEKIVEWICEKPSGPPVRDEDAEIPGGPPWPTPLGEAAFHGVAGDLVRAILPHTEADPAALLVQFLLGFGNMVGRGPHYRVGADYHHLNLFAVLVGATSKGRKGSAWNAVQMVLGAVDQHWADNQIASGLSSGEGLIHAVRDPVEEQKPIRDPKSRKVTGYETVVSDAGEQDKRLMVLEPEFASPLRIAERDGNVLTAILRQGWDAGQLRTLRRNSPAKATGAHISLVGHVTKDELLRYLSTTEAGNGFANRFLWICVQRSKMLPDGGQLQQVDFAPILRRLNDVVAFAKSAGELMRDLGARALWHQEYPRLTADRIGMFGAVTGRAEAITLRLSCLYALLDRSEVIQVPHLAAALEVWRYAEDSARFVFGDALGDQVADAILMALRERPEGMTRTDISFLFDRNRSAQQIKRALKALQTLGLARSEREETGGRPTERWFAC